MTTTTTQRIIHRAIGTTLAVAFMTGLSLTLPDHRAVAAPDNRDILVTDAGSPAPMQGIWGKTPRPFAEPRKG